VRAWKPVLACALAAAPVVVAVGATYAAFSSTTGTSGSFAAKRIYTGERSSSAWQLEDAADGSASDQTQLSAYIDGLVRKTGNWTNAWSGTRYIEVELHSPLAAGLAVSNAAFAFTFADDDGNAGNQWCFFFEVRRTSTAQLLGTHGSSGSPVGCEAAGVQTTFSTTLSEVTTSDLANDLTIRVFGMHSGGGKAINIDRAVVTGTAHSTFTLFSNHLIDSSTGTATTYYWGPAKVNNQAFQNAGNWDNLYQAGRYLKFTFPPYVPGSATVTAASFDYTYASQTSGTSTCYYFEVYAGTTLIGTHGSTSSDVDCNATTSYETISTSLPEIDTAAEARTAVIKLFSKNSGSKPTLTDAALLKVTYSLDSGVTCLDPGTTSLTPTQDAHVEENNPTNNYATGVDLKVKSHATNDDRRAYVQFNLPSIPANCSLTSATLRMFLNGTQGTRTIEAYAAAGSWTETGLTWNNQPGFTGSAATVSNTAGFVTFTVTSQVQAMYSSTNYGFMLKDSVEESATSFENKFDSDENTNRPELTVTFG
jgi:hypothetical protein